MSTKDFSSAAKAAVVHYCNTKLRKRCKITEKQVFILYQDDKHVVLTDGFLAFLATETENDAMTLEVWEHRSEFAFKTMKKRNKMMVSETEKEVKVK